MKMLNKVYKVKINVSIETIMKTAATKTMATATQFIHIINLLILRQ